MSKKLEIKQVKSSIGRKPDQRATLIALGLRRMNMKKVHEDNPVIRGMIRKVEYLLEVKEIS